MSHGSSHPPWLMARRSWTAPPAVTQVAYDAGGLITLARTRAGHGQVVACDHPDALREVILWRYDVREAW